MTTQKRNHRSVDDPEFHDPLKNYRPTPPVDDLERALCEGEVGSLPTTPFASVPPTITIEQAVRKMAQFDVGCLLVVEQQKLLGLFTQRDLLNRVAERYEQIKDQAVSSIMTPEPVVVRNTDNPAKAINLMAVGGFRHIPVLDIDGHVVGLLGPRRITAYLRQYFPVESAPTPM